MRLNIPTVSVFASGVALGVILAKHRLRLVGAAARLIASISSSEQPAAVVHVVQAADVPVAPVDGKITVVYWDICGLAQPIRLALALAGVEFADVRIDAKNPGSPEYKQVWFDAKNVVGQSVVFPNLPYILDGGVGLSQSNTCLRYVGRKYDLMGPPGCEHLIDFVLDQMADFDGAITSRCYRDVAALKGWCFDELPWHLREWEKLIGGSDFVGGSTCTIADVKLYETLRKIMRIEADARVRTATLQKHPVMLAYISRFEAQPRIQAYMASSAYLASPMNNPHAKLL